MQHPISQLSDATAHRDGVLQRQPSRPRCFHITLLAVTAILATALVSLGVATAVLHRAEPSALHALAKAASSAPVPRDVERIQRRLEAVEGVDPQQALELHLSAGRALHDLGRFSAAVDHFQRAQGLAQPGAERIVAEKALAATRLNQGKLTEARRILESALDHASEGEQSVGVLHALGDVRREMGHLDDAILLYGKARELASPSGDLEVEELPLLLADIGEAHARKGDVDSAFRWLSEASQACAANSVRRRLAGGPAVPELDRARIQSLLGTVHQQRGDSAQALRLFREALPVQLRALHPAHGEVVGTRISMARTLRDLGQRDDALNAIGAVERTVRAGPMEGMDLGRVLLVKADLLRELRRFEEALAAIEGAAQLQVAVSGEDRYPEGAVALNIYGGLLQDQGKLQEALAKYRQALELNLATVGEMHPETAATHNSLGTLSEETGSLDDARQHFLKALQIQIAVSGDRSPDVANSYNNLATVAFRQGRVTEAAQTLRKALRLIDSGSVPKGSPDRQVYQDNLNEILAANQTQLPNAKP